MAAPCLWNDLGCLGLGTPFLAPVVLCPLVRERIHWNGHRATAFDDGRSGSIHVVYPSPSLVSLLVLVGVVLARTALPAAMRKQPRRMVRAVATIALVAGLAEAVACAT